MSAGKRSWTAGPLRIRVSTDSTAGTRAGRPREPLTVGRIVDTALELMRTEGYDGVSMRSVAKALGTGPASLYAHVANRQDLDQLIADRISQGLTVPEADPDRWEEQLRQMARDMLALYREHPGSARATMGIVPTGEGALRAAEGMVAVCLAGGIPRQYAAWMCDLLAQFVSAFAAEEAIWEQRAAEAGVEGAAQLHQQLHDFFWSLPADRYPLLASMGQEMTSGDGQDRFEFGIDVLVQGLAAKSGR